MHFNDLIWKNKARNSENTNSKKDKCRRHEMSYRSQFDSHSESTLLFHWKWLLLETGCSVCFPSLLVDDRLVYAKRQIHMAWCRGGVARRDIIYHFVFIMTWLWSVSASQPKEVFVFVLCVRVSRTRANNCKRNILQDCICTALPKICFINYKSYADISTFVIIQLNLCIVYTNHFGFII